MVCPGGCSSGLGNPMLMLCSSKGAVVAIDYDWQDNPAQASEINAAGLAPASNHEAAISAALPPRLYTLRLAGSNGH